MVMTAAEPQSSCFETFIVAPSLQYEKFLLYYEKFTLYKYTILQIGLGLCRIKFLYFSSKGMHRKNFYFTLVSKVVSTTQHQMLKGICCKNVEDCKQNAKWQILK